MVRPSSNSADPESYFQILKRNGALNDSRSHIHLLNHFLKIKEASNLQPAVRNQKTELSTCVAKSRNLKKPMSSQSSAAFGNLILETEAQKLWVVWGRRLSRGIFTEWKRLLRMSISSRSSIVELGRSWNISSNLRKRDEAFSHSRSHILLLNYFLQIKEASNLQAAACVTKIRMRGRMISDVLVFLSKMPPPSCCLALRPHTSSITTRAKSLPKRQETNALTYLPCTRMRALPLSSETVTRGRASLCSIT